MAERMMSASRTNLPSNPAGVAARLSTNGAFWLGRSGLLLRSNLLRGRGDGLARAGRSVGHCVVDCRQRSVQIYGLGEGDSHRRTGSGGRLLGEARGRALMYPGRWATPVGTCLLLIPLFSFIYRPLSSWPPDTRPCFPDASSCIRRHTPPFPAPRNPPRIYIRETGPSQRE